MSQTAKLEERLTILEKEVAELKRRLPQTPSGLPVENWVERVAGSFKDDPEFGEILRLGREIRQADRPADDE